MEHGPRQKPRRVRPLAESETKALRSLITKRSAVALARRWDMGAPTIRRAARGEGLTSAVRHYLASMISRETPAA